MAQDSVWIAAASLLWAFEMGKAVDGSGAAEEISGNYTFGVVRYVLTFAMYDKI